MDRRYPQKLHKYELVLRGFYLKVLRLQIKPFKDFFVSYGYFGSPEALIVTTALKTAYTDSYRYVSDAEMYIQWLLLEQDFKSQQKDAGDDNDNYLVVSETLRNTMLQAALINYNAIQSDLNQTTIDSINDYIEAQQAKGVSDSAIISGFEDVLRQRSALIASTEATTILNTLKYTVSSMFFSQKGTTGYKTWFTRQDERVRHTHEEVDGRTIPMDTKFVLNRRDGGIEFATYPGEATLSAGNRIRCRCMLEYSSSPDTFKKK